MCVVHLSLNAHFEAIKCRDMLDFPVKCTHSYNTHTHKCMAYL